MKKYFYFFLFVTSFIIAEKESLVDIALTHLNPDNLNPANKVVVKIATKRQEQLKILQQERTKYAQELEETNKSIEETEKEIATTKNQTEHELLQKINQILHKTALDQQGLISLLKSFIKKTKS